MKLELGQVTIQYLITGQQDGRWIVQAYTSGGETLGGRVEVKTPSEAWKIFMVLNGYSCEEPFDADDLTQDIIGEAA